MAPKNGTALVLLLTILTSCGTLSGIKKPLPLIDMPDNLIVRNLETGDTLKIEEGIIGFSTTKRFQYNYIGQRVKFKPKKNTTLELEANGVKKTIEISKKTDATMLVLEGLYTFGAFTLVDLITGGYRSHNPSFIDCPALFEDKEPRTEDEILNYVKVNSHFKNK